MPHCQVCKMCARHRALACVQHEGSLVLDYHSHPGRVCEGMQGEQVSTMAISVFAVWVRPAGCPSKGWKGSHITHGQIFSDALDQAKVQALRSQPKAVSNKVCRRWGRPGGTARCRSLRCRSCLFCISCQPCGVRESDAGVALHIPVCMPSRCHEAGQEHCGSHNTDCWRGKHILDSKQEQEAMP